MMTQELQDLAALSMEHGQIPSGLYDQYHVLRGLRDVNGKGVLAGLTDISTITSSKEVDGRYPRSCRRFCSRAEIWL